MRAFLKEKPKYLTGPNTMHAGDYEEPLAYNECRTKCFQHENTPEEMNEVFKHIGLKPPNPLFELFGKERVEAELDEFLKFDFFPRFGAGIGLTRLARAWTLLKSKDNQ